MAEHGEFRHQIGDLLQFFEDDADRERARIGLKLDAARQFEPVLRRLYELFGDECVAESVRERAACLAMGKTDWHPSPSQRRRLQQVKTMDDLRARHVKEDQQRHFDEPLCSLPRSGEGWMMVIDPNGMPVTTYVRWADYLRLTAGPSERVAS